MHKKILSFLIVIAFCFQCMPCVLGATETVARVSSNEVVLYETDFEDWTDQTAQERYGDTHGNPSSHDFQTWTNYIAGAGKDSGKALSPVFGMGHNYRILRFIPAPLAKTGSYHFRFDFRFGTSESEWYNQNNSNEGGSSAIRLDKDTYGNGQNTIFDLNDLQKMGENWYRIDIKVDINNAKWTAKAVPYADGAETLNKSGNLDAAAMPKVLSFACYSSDTNKRTLETVPLVDNFSYAEEMFFPGEQIMVAETFEDWTDSDVAALYNKQPTEKSSFLTWCNKIAKGKEGQGLSPTWGEAGVLAQPRRDIEFIPVPALSGGTHHFRFDFRAGTSEDKSGTISLVNPTDNATVATIFNSDHLIEKWGLEWYCIDIAVDCDSGTFTATATPYTTGETAETSGSFNADAVKLSFVFQTDDTSKRTLDTVPVIDNFFFTTVVKYKKPLLLQSITSAKTGNIFGSSEEAALKLNYTNRAAYEVNADIDIKVKSSDGTTVWTETLSETFDKNEQKTLRIKPQNANRYDIYSIEVSTDTAYATLPEETTETAVFASEFSRTWNVPKDKMNDKYGTATLGYMYGWSETDGVATAVAADAGIVWNRDEVQWRECEKEKGVYKIPDSFLNDLKKAKAAGMKNQVGLLYNNPIYEGSSSKPVPTGDALTAYYNYCEWFIKETKGLVDAYSVWNEYNHKDFNPTSETAEYYVEMLKTVYGLVKQYNPDALVLGLEAAGIDTDFIDGVFRAGGAQYMDVAAVHPYDWSGHFDTKAIIKNSNTMKNIMTKYGDAVPIWWTEFGFSAAYSDAEQANGLVMAYCLQECYDLADATFQFRMQDDLDNAMEREQKWGFIRDYADETKPNAAKPSYLAVSAMNNLIGSMAEAKEVINEGTDYVFRFRNNDLQKDVAVIIGEYASTKVNLDIGCASVDVYDAYGNKTSDSASDGEYHFMADTAPIYVVGDFERLSVTYEPAVTLTKVKNGAETIASAADFHAGDTVEVYAKWKNPSETNVKKACVIFACYKDGALVRCALQSVDLTHSNGNAESKLTEFTIPQTAEFDSVTMMCWNSGAKMQPLSKALVFPS